MKIEQINYSYDASKWCGIVGEESKRDNAGLAWADPVSLWFEGGEPARGKLEATQQAGSHRCAAAIMNACKICILVRPGW